MRADLFQFGRKALGLLLAPYGRPTSPDPKGAILYTSPSTRRVRALCPDGTDVGLSGSGGSGTLNHAALTSNLAWGTSGHTGTASHLAGFSGAGAATYYQIGVDVHPYHANAVIVADAAPTLATGYAMRNGLLETAASNTFTVARSIAAASPEYGWTWANRTALTSADENTTTAGAVHFVHDTTSTDWSSSAQTAPYRYQTMRLRNGDVLEVIALCYSNGNANYEAVGIVVCRDAAGGTLIKAAVGAVAGTVSLQAYNGTSTSSTTVTTGERDAGVWLRIRTQFNGTGTATSEVSYNKTASATPPTAESSWTVQTVYSSNFVPGDVLRVGQVVNSTGASASLTGGIKWWGVRIGHERRLATTPEAYFQAIQYDTTAAEQPVVASWDLGVSTATVSQAAVRTILGYIENILAEDSGATWTWSVERGAAPSPASGTYYAASAVVVAATGRYLAIYAKCSSSGATRGSINLAGIRIPYTP